MPCPHNEITIVQRSQRQSAVAAAAYQSGEKLFCEYDQQVKHYPEKRGIVHNEILLPANAPQKYADRNTLWNAAEAVEKQWNSQLASGVLPVKRTIKNNKFLYRQPCYGWRYFMLLLYIAHDISLVSLHAVFFEVVGCCSNLCN